MATRVDIQDLLDQPQMEIGPDGQAVVWWSGITAAAPPSATQCICPSPTIDISAYNSAARNQVVKKFKESKVTPAYGGAAIHKAAEQVISSNVGTLLPDLDVWEVLAIMDWAVPKKGAFTYLMKYKAWFDSPAGKKTVGNAPGPHKHVSAPIAHPPSPIATVSTPIKPKLPPVAPKPDPGSVQYTGKTLGSHGAQVWVNPVTNEKWLFKPQAEFLTDLDVAMARLESKALLTRPGVYKITLNGKTGSIQYMFPNSTSAFPNFDVLKLSDADIAVLQREQIFDWMISNWDAHTEQFIRTGTSLVGVDKGQAFKFFGKDKLDWDWYPQGNIGTWIYQPMWKAYATGKNVKLNDPTQGELGEFIDNLMAIPDQDYRDLLLPYAQSRFTGAGLTQFLDQAVARKHSLKSDFATYWAKAQASRQQHTGTPIPPTPPVTQSIPVSTPPPAPTVAKAAPTIGDPGDISGVGLHTKVDIADEWLKLGGGKKVTPAWGGAKIFKMLEQLHDWAEAGGDPLTHLQLLRILDSQGGFTGKPKTYENVVLDWLASPQSTNTLLKLGLTEPPDSLKPGVNLFVHGPTLHPTSSVKPITPVSQAVPDDAATTLADPSNKISTGLFQELHKYQNDEVVAYIKTANGDTLQLRKQQDVFGNPLVEVFVRKDSLGKTTWDYDSAANNVAKLINEYNLSKPVQFSMKTAKSVAPGKSIIPGYGPGDVVPTVDINAAKFMWPKGVIGTDEDFNTLYKLESDGQGGFIVSWAPKSMPNDWSPGPTLTGVPNASYGKVMQWKLTGAAKPTTKPSFFSGKNAGDVIDVDDIWGSVGNAVPGDVIAYAKNHMHPTEILKLHMTPNGLTLGSKYDANNPWVDIAQYDNKISLSLGTKVYTWYASHLDGSMPDQFKVLVPGSNVPGAKTPTKWVGKYAFFNGDDVPDYVWWDIDHVKTMAWDDGDIIATATNPYAEYRVFYWGGQLFQESKPQGGDWVATKKIIQQPVAVEWKAAHGNIGKFSSSANSAKFLLSKPPPAPKAAKKSAKLPTPAPPTSVVKKTLKGDETHIPGKTTNDTSDQAELFKYYDQYTDGTIVATMTDKYYPYGHYRLVVIEYYDATTNSVKTKLVQQKQTKTGTWTSTKFIDNHWNIEYGAWKLSNDKVTAQHLLNMKKAYAKKTQPKPPPAPKSTTPGTPKSSVSLNVTPFQMQHVDLSPWNDSEQEEIYQFFRGKSIYTGSSEQQIWSGVQAVKSHFAQKGGKWLNLTEIEILRMVDARSALKHGVVDTHPFEAKIVQWLKTPGGNAFVNKRIDAPIAAFDVPVPMSATIDRALMDKEVYRVVSLSEARADRAASHAQYGAYTGAQKAALKKYTGGVYTSWNDAIRKGDISTYRADILNAQRGMRPSTRPMLLHRGTDFYEFNDPSITDCNSLKNFVGRTYINRGFNSTSVGGKAAFTRPVIIEFRAPTGTPMAHVQDFSHHPGENETILPAHMVYEIQKVECTSGRTTMTVLVLGPATP